MAATAQPVDATHAPRSLVVRYFDISLYILILTGFLTLLSTGKLDLPWTGIVSVLLAYRGVLLARGKNYVVPDRWTSYLSLAYIAFYAVDYFIISGSFLTATVHMVLFSMMLKIFSVQRDRDHIYLAVLSFLMVLSAALLTVDVIFLAVFFVFMLLAVTTFMSMEMKRSSKPRVSASSRTPHSHFARTLSLFGFVMVLAMMAGAAAIFFVLPRVSAGYLTAFAPRNDLVTGFSETVRLGDIGKIQQSSSVVMHVQFSDHTSPPADLKWRGVALSTFDRGRWSNPLGSMVVPPNAYGHFPVGNRAMTTARLAPPKGATPAHRPPLVFTSYRVLMEPIGTNVFFLATDPFELAGNYREVAIDAGGSVFNSDRDRPVTVYQGRSLLPATRGAVPGTFPPLPGSESELYLQLPAMDPRVKDLAQKVAASSTEDWEQALALEKHLRTHYGYTLDLPPARVADPIANFLFERKKGHCEYFASAMAIMLRTLGIPSRVVNGFRNGQYNDLTGSYIIRASDAHSWVEAYIAGYGWMTFDPTPPDLSHENSAWTRMMFYADAGKEFWREWVINYDYRHRENLGQGAINKTHTLYHDGSDWLRVRLRMLSAMARKLERTATRQPGTATLVLLAALLGIVLLFFSGSWLKYRRSDSLARHPHLAPRLAATVWYRKMTAKTAKSGWVKLPSQTPHEFALSIGEAEIRSSVKRFTDCYERARFDDSIEDAVALPQLYEEIELVK